MIILKVNQIDKVQKDSLSQFIKQYSVSPYLYLEYQNVIEDNFKYINVSLVAINNENDIVGFLAQWIVNDKIESIPWRDRGGPIYRNENVLKGFIKYTEQIVHENKLKGFLWKDFYTKDLETRKYFQIVELDLASKSEEELWKQIKNRRNIKKAEKSELKFIAFDKREGIVDIFYELFVDTRRRLGVPVYNKKLFESTISNLNNNSAFFSVEDKNGKVLAMILLVYNQKIAIYSYGASDSSGNEFRANEFLMWNTIITMKNLGVEKFDFGADSPLQESLIHYKLKWGGVQRNVWNSFKGTIKEQDHNLPHFSLIKKIISVLPKKIYLFLSNTIVR